MKLNIFKENELKLLWPFYLTHLIYGLSIMIAPFLVIYFLDLGFSYFQISIIIASIGVCMFLFEMPTGIFADTHGRKKSTILGYFLVGIFILLLPLSNNYYYILICFALSGIAMTFISGAEEAWIVHNLNENNFKEFREEYFRKTQIIMMSGAIIAPIIGGIIVKYSSIKPLWYIYGIGFIINSIILLLFAKEHFIPEKKNIKDSFKHTIIETKESFKFIYTHKIVFLLTFASILLSLTAIGNDGKYPFLTSLSMPLEYLGYFMSLNVLIGLIFTIIFKNNFFKPKILISITILIETILTFLLLFVQKPYWIIAVILFILASSIVMISKPALQSYIHNYIPEEKRATILSTQSMIMIFFSTITALIGGYLLDIFGPQKVIAYSSLFGIFAIICYLKINDDEKESNIK